MPEAGYGQFPINQSVSITAEQRRRLEEIKAAQGGSLADAARYLIELGIKAHDAKPRGRDVLFSGPAKP